MNKSNLQLLQIPCCVYCAIGTRGAAVFEIRQMLVGTNTPGAPTAPLVAYYS
jgi:protein tyrosine phosphatase (PTP) superfamily phosphohydrolase (DUF442 family)